jgi:hypothetical protein
MQLVLVETENGPEYRLVPQTALGTARRTISPPRIARSVPLYGQGMT